MLGAHQWQHHRALQKFPAWGQFGPHGGEAIKTGLTLVVGLNLYNNYNIKLISYKGSHTWHMKQGIQALCKIIHIYTDMYYIKIVHILNIYTTYISSRSQSSAY